VSRSVTRFKRSRCWGCGHYFAQLKITSWNYCSELCQIFARLDARDAQAALRASRRDELTAIKQRPVTQAEDGRRHVQAWDRRRNRSVAIRRPVPESPKRIRKRSRLLTRPDPDRATIAYRALVLRCIRRRTFGDVDEAGAILEAAGKTWDDLTADYDRPFF
jgi:hypothetical protein